MKTPLKSYKKRFRSAAYLKSLVPVGSIVDSLLFFSGQLEFKLAAEGRYIRARTCQYYIYEFWSCMSQNPKRVYEIVKADKFDLHDAEIFTILQENWTTYRDPFIRAALFFLLNQGSQTGLISTGTHTYKKHSPFAAHSLRNFIMPSAIHLTLDKELYDPIVNRRDGAYTLIPIGKYRPTFVKQSNFEGHELSQIDHARLAMTIEESSHPCIVLYEWHPRIKDIFKGFNVQMIDGGGALTAHSDQCEELVVTNF